MNHGLAIGQFNMLHGIRFGYPLRFANSWRVKDGDLIVADIDGVVVVPAAREEEILEAAFGEVRGESAVRDMILAG